MSQLEIELQHCALFLQRIEIDPGNAAILLFGEELIGKPFELIPEKIQKEIVKLLSCMSRAEESIDPIEKKLFTIQAELLDFIIRKQISDHCKECDRKYRVEENVEVVK